MFILKHIRNILLLTLCIYVFSNNVMSVEAAPDNSKLTNNTFDAEYYYNTYPDLQVLIGKDPTALYNHYIRHGLQEGRYGSAEFNCVVYMNNNHDLRTVFKDDYLSYCLHYEQYGKAEKRNAATPAIIPNVAGVSDKALGSYSSVYDATIPRAINVELAASRINGIILKPGDEFSYSKTILPRTAENGYVEALIINNKKYTLGIGGGICQVSSTLYAAMITAGLPATERHPHSLPVSYIPEGMDATIAEPIKDLKFINIYNHDIQLIATTDNGTLTVSIIKK